MNTSNYSSRCRAIARAIRSARLPVVKTAVWDEALESTDISLAYIGNHGMYKADLFVNMPEPEIHFRELQLKSRSNQLYQGRAENERTIPVPSTQQTEPLISKIMVIPDSLPNEKLRNCFEPSRQDLTLLLLS